MPRRRVGIILPTIVNQAGVTMPPPNAAVAMPMKKSKSAKPGASTANSSKAMPIKG